MGLQAPLREGLPDLFYDFIIDQHIDIVKGGHVKLL